MAEIVNLRQVRKQKRAKAKDKQVARPGEQYIADQGKNQPQADPAPIVGGRCIMQPAQQRQYRQRLDQQAQQFGMHAYPVEEGHRPHQRQNEPAHQFTVIAQSKVSTGSTSGAQGCCEVRRRRPVPLVKA